MYVLGLKCHGHDTGAALIKEIEGELEVVAISESRLNRRKHSYAYPLLSIDYVLDHFNLKSLDEIDYICIDKHFEIWPEKDSQFGFFDAWRHFGKSEKYDVDSKLSYLVEQSIKIPYEKLIWVGHIDAHAASAYYVSGFEDAAILTMEGGMGLYSATKNDISIVNRNGYMCEEYENGKVKKASILTRSVRMNISHFYDAITQKLGLDQFAAGKTMALAAFKDTIVCRDILNIPKDRPKDFSFDYAHVVEEISRKVKQFTSKNDEDMLDEYWVNISREAQETLEEEVIGFAELAAQKVNTKNLCLAGGVALSCVTNRKILDSKFFENVFVQPAASDEGIALGSALWGYYQVAKGTNPIKFDTAYLGRKNDLSSLEENLQKWGFEYEKTTTQDVAKLLADGKILARSNGACEFGPRALGNRSILADPRIENMMDVVNTRVKHRERFRPFAPACIEEKQNLYFDIPVKSPFMLMATQVLDDMKDKIPGIMHVDGSSRVQTVNADQNPGFYELLNEFGKISGVYVLLNTSFNDNGEAIAETHLDAMLSFVRTGLDYLYIEEYLVMRPTPERVEELKITLAADVQKQIDSNYDQAIEKYCDEKKFKELQNQVENPGVIRLVSAVLKHYLFSAKVRVVKSNSYLPRSLWVDKFKLGALLVRGGIFIVSFPLMFFADLRRALIRLFKA